MASSKYTEEQFIEAVKKSYSYSGVCREIGISPKGGNLNTVKKKIEQLNLDASHFTGQRWNKGKTSETHSSIKKKDTSEILIENSGWTSSNIRNRLLKEGLKEHKCECCGRSEWMGVPIPLELHHINENHYDNRLENLLILYPNCHALTDSHTNIDKLKEIIDKQQIIGKEMTEILKNKFDKLQEVQKEKDNNIKNLPKKDPKYCAYCGKELVGEARRNTYCSTDCAHKANGSKRPEKEELIIKFKELGSFVQVGKYYEVSDNAVRKWCKYYDIIDI